MSEEIKETKIELSEEEVQVMIEKQKDEIAKGLRTGIEKELTDKFNKENLNREKVRFNGSVESADEVKKALNEDFKSFLKSDDLKLKGLTIPIPEKYLPEIVPTPGQWNIKANCRSQGVLDSTVMNIARSISGGTANWMSATGGGSDATITATAIPVNMDCITVKVPIYDYQLTTKGYNALSYVNSEVNKSIPKAEAKQILAGTGSPFTGIYGDTDVNSVTLGVTGALNVGLTLSALRAMVSTIDGDFRNNDLKWYVDLTEEQTLLGVCDDNNRITDIATGVNRVLGYEVVPVSEGVLNGLTETTTGSKHFILANLKEAIDYAEQGLKVEAIRTTQGKTDYYFYNYEAFGVRQPKAACICKLHL